MDKHKTFRATGIALLVGLGVAAGFYTSRAESGGPTQSTDNAYVEADFTTIGPQVPGTVKTVLVQDNQEVSAGDLLAVIDNREFLVAVRAAQAKVTSAQARVAGLQAQLLRQESAIRQEIATVAIDEASLKLARENQVRYLHLSEDGSGTVQALQQADAQVSIQSATLEKNHAGVQAARQQVLIFRADLRNARAALEESLSAQSAAELKLSYTRITAPVGGMVGNKSIRVGAFVHVGQALLAIVPIDRAYITANFRETQLARVRQGQAVDIVVDALPGTVLTGVVESLGPATGVSYSAVAPHNATGNFTKIVQRLPVRIRIDPGQPAAARLRIGMSAEPKIHVDR